MTHAPSIVDTGLNDARVDLAVAQGQLCDRKQLLRDYQRDATRRYGPVEDWPAPAVSTELSLRQVVTTLEERVREAREFVGSIEELTS